MPFFAFIALMAAEPLSGCQRQPHVQTANCRCHDSLIGATALDCGRSMRTSFRGECSGRRQLHRPWCCTAWQRDGNAPPRPGRTFAEQVDECISGMVVGVSLCGICASAADGRFRPDQARRLRQREYGLVSTEMRVRRAKDQSMALKGTEGTPSDQRLDDALQGTDARATTEDLTQRVAFLRRQLWKQIALDA